MSLPNKARQGASNNVFCLFLDSYSNLSSCPRRRFSGLSSSIWERNYSDSSISIHSASNSKSSASVSAIMRNTVGKTKFTFSPQIVTKRTIHTDVTNSTSESPSTKASESSDPPTIEIAPTNRLPFDLQMDYMLTKIPVGRMNREQVKICKQAIRTLSYGNPVSNQANKKDKKEVFMTRTSAAVTAEKLLDRLVEESLVNPDTVQLQSKQYNRCIKAWALSCRPLHDDNQLPENEGDEKPMFRAHQLLKKMHLLHQEHPDTQPAPDDYSYSTVLLACANQSHLDEAPVLAEKLINQLEANASKLRELNGTEEDKLALVVPTIGTYNNLIMVFANRASVHYGAASTAEDWLMHMSKLAANEGGPAPDTGCFNRVLKAWNVSPEENGADRALEILELMLKLVKNDPEYNSHVKPDHLSFGTVINAFGRRFRPSEGEEVFKKALDYFHSAAYTASTVTTNANGIEVETETKILDLTYCLNGAMMGWAASGKQNAPERMEALLRDGYTVSKSLPPSIHLKPNDVSHTCCIEAYLNLGMLEEADAHLQRQLELYTEKKCLPPSTLAFNLVIRAWNKRCRNENTNIEAEKWAERMMNNLKRMIFISEQNEKYPGCVPNRITFHACIDAWCTQRASKHQAFRARRALEILEMAEKRQLSDFFSYSSVINALCRARNAECTYEAVKVLQRAEKEIEHRNLRCDHDQLVGLYTLLIASLARIESQEAANLALQLLEDMKNKRKLQPSISTYTSVIGAFGRLRRRESGKVAFELFEEIKNLDADTHSKVQLDKVAFKNTLRALATAGDKESADKACSVLSQMLQLHAQGRKGVEPDTLCFDACLYALADSRESSFISRASEILKTIVQKHEVKALSHLPSPGAFLAVIRACKVEGGATFMKEAEDIEKIFNKLSAPHSK